MYYIVFDLELNQDFSSISNSCEKDSLIFEIIQLGAVKLDSRFNTVDTFNRYVKPTVYTKISPFITELTGITTEQLQIEENFTEVYNAFLDFIADTNSVFCIWGTTDMKELFKNAEMHMLSTKALPRSFINIQIYVSLYFNFSKRNLLRLQHAVEALNIPIENNFHDAFSDALYTAEVFKKIYNTYMQPMLFDPSPPSTLVRPPKRVINVEGLINQFEKMYSRKMTEEEQNIILLAYKMGKTGQFLT